jgi:hypothetical protein
MLMGNESHICCCSWCWHGRFEVFTSGKIVQLRNVHHVPTINKKNLVSCSVLCKDGFKVVLESNILVVSEHMDHLLVKAMIREAYFTFLLLIFVICLRTTFVAMLVMI